MKWIQKTRFFCDDDFDDDFNFDFVFVFENFHFQKIWISMFSSMALSKIASFSKFTSVFVRAFFVSEKFISNDDLHSFFFSENEFNVFEWIRKRTIIDNLSLSISNFDCFSISISIFDFSGAIVISILIFDNFDCLTKVRIQFLNQIVEFPLQIFDLLKLLDRL